MVPASASSVAGVMGTYMSSQIDADGQAGHARRRK